MKYEIIKEDIRRNIRNERIRFGQDPFEHGVICMMDGFWFPIGGDDTKACLPERYLAKTPEDEVVQAVFDSLLNREKDERRRMFYDYCIEFLQEDRRNTYTVKVITTTTIEVEADSEEEAIEKACGIAWEYDADETDAEIIKSPAVGQAKG